MKKDENKKQKIGVLAQDIEKVFPELVSESNGVKSVNYQGLVPVLINALKEQQVEIEALKKEQDTKLNKQQAEIDELKAIVTKLITP
jgi:ribosomal protein S7